MFAKPEDLAPDYVLISRRVVMQGDLSIGQRLFGGTLLAWIDESLAMLAVSITGTPDIATRKMSEVEFFAPARLCDQIEIWGRPAHLGRTSLSIECHVYARRPADQNSKFILISSCTMVFVALDAEGKAFPWNPYAPSSSRTAK
jgi:acyl-CoA hydrolase